jgi:hypothetical protein
MTSPHHPGIPSHVPGDNRPDAVNHKNVHGLAGQRVTANVILHLWSEDGPSP